MNKWQMEGRSIKWDSRGGSASDDKGKTQYSIHRFGRSEEYRLKQRRKNRHEKN